MSLPLYKELRDLETDLSKGFELSQGNKSQREGEGLG